MSGRSTAAARAFRRLIISVPRGCFSRRSRFPARYLSPTADVITTPEQLVTDFVKTNRDLTASMLSVQCGNARDRARLSELRVCLDRRGNFAACGANEYRSLPRHHPCHAARPLRATLMKKALILQHMNHDHPGRFLDWFAEDGILPVPVRMFEGQQIPPLKDYDFMFVLGGAQDTWQEADYPYLAEEKSRSANGCGSAPEPYFGVCLGHQLLATALGGEVAPADEGEVGVYDVALTEEGRAARAFEGLPDNMPGDAVAPCRSEAHALRVARCWRSQKTLRVQCARHR
jgi:GMP synthase-like glutamine amidotransferase